MKGKASLLIVSPLSIVYTVELYLHSILCCISLKACSKFVNNNEVTKLAKSSAKSPELLAKFCDTLLRKRYNYVTMCSYSIVCSLWVSC